MLDFGAPREMDMLTAAARGMNAQRTVLDLAAHNVAAAQASTPDHPYRRLVAQFAGAAGGGVDADAENGDETTGDESAAESAAAPAIAGIRSEAGSGDALAEMIAVLDAQRAYEQNASVFDIGKRLAERTIDVGRS